MQQSLVDNIDLASPIGSFESNPVLLTGKGVYVADPQISLMVSPDRVVSPDADTVLGLYFKVTNAGNSRSWDTHFELNFDPTLIPSSTKFSDPNIWVTAIEKGKIHVALPSMEAGQSVEGTIFFITDPDNLPVVGNKLSFHAKLFFSDVLTGGTRSSNTVGVEIGPKNVDETTGKVMLMKPAEVKVKAGESVEVSGDFFNPNERLSGWLTAPDGTSQELSLGYNYAGPEGTFSMTLKTAGMAPGSYVVAIHGHISNITGRTILIIE